MPRGVPKNKATKPVEPETPVVPTQPEPTPVPEPEPIQATPDLDAEIKAKEERLAELAKQEKEMEDKLSGKIPLVPAEFRRVVDEILGAEFGLEVKTFSDRPTFAISITVPKEYTNLTNLDLDKLGVDRRTKVIPNSEGLEGVKRWAEAVRKNLKSSFETTKPQVTN